MELNIEELTLKQIREIVALVCAKPTRKAVPFRERAVVVRSSGGVYFGRLVACTGSYGRLSDARHIRTWTSPPGVKAIRFIVLRPFRGISCTLWPSTVSLTPVESVFNSGVSVVTSTVSVAAPI